MAVKDHMTKPGHLSIYVSSVGCAVDLELILEIGDHSPRYHP